ncbi:MAG: peptidylprolyl isomerase [Endozoicomonadaceae bacterium]|nr:peptidylprolyl isomerase [Endozoicomonadaceae bacterium]
MKKGDQVLLHFSLSCDQSNESCVDSTFEGEPVELMIGSGQMPARFEKLMQNVLVNQEKTFTLSPEQGFGEKQENNIKRLSMALFKSVDLKIGLVVAFDTANHEEILGVVQNISDTIVTVDFNHPLAGRILYFKVFILKIRPGNRNALPEIKDIMLTH